MTNGLKQLPPELNPDGNAVINTLQQLAGAIGTSIITTIVAASQAKLPDDLAAATAQGTQYSFYLLAVLAAAVICCSLGVFALTGKKEEAVALIMIENIYTFYCSVCVALSLWSQSYTRQIRIKCINIPDMFDATAP